MLDGFSCAKEVFKEARVDSSPSLPLVMIHTIVC